jgi:hypothetical protein
MNNSGDYSRSLSIFVRSRLFAGIVMGVGITLIVLCIFEVGIAIGYHEATFSSHWGANYGTNFGGGDYGLDAHQPTAHGSTGKILSVDTTGATTTIIVDGGTSHPEQKVLVTSDTVIRSQENTLTASALTVGVNVVVLGTPDDTGVIDAKLIRIVPAADISGASAIPAPGIAPNSPGSTSSPYAAP